MTTQDLRVRGDNASGQAAWPCAYQGVGVTFIATDAAVRERADGRSARRHSDKGLVSFPCCPTHAGAAMNPTALLISGRVGP